MANLDPYVISMLSHKLGTDVTTPAGATQLSHDIESVTGEHLGRNTVKRLMGIIPYENNPRRATLEILANYLGFESWAVLTAYINDRVSQFGNEPFMSLNDVADGKKVRIEWQPDRKIVIQQRGEGRFEVISSENSKLKAGDILEQASASQGFPLLVKSVIRGGKNLGTYTAAAEFGVSKLSVSDE